jgi:hypothetical protein
MCGLMIIPATTSTAMAINLRTKLNVSSKAAVRIAVIFLVFAAYSPLTLRSQFQESTPLAVRHS